MPVTELPADATPAAAAEWVAGREELGFTLGLAPPEGMHLLTVRDQA